MRATTGKRWRFWVGRLLEGMALGFVACVVCVVFLTLFPRPWRFERRAEQARILAAIPDAEARWAQSGITDYEVEVELFAHLGVCGTDLDDVPIVVQMRDGEAVITEDVRQPWLGEPCSIPEAFLPPRVFTTLRERLREEDGENDIRVAFDPQYGYVTVYRVSGWANNTDLFYSYRFANLRPITDTVPAPSP